MEIYQDTIREEGDVVGGVWIGKLNGKGRRKGTGKLEMLNEEEKY